MPSPTYSIQNIMSVHYSLSVPNHIHLYAYASVYCVINVEYLSVPMQGRKQVSLLQCVFKRVINLFIVLVLSRASHTYLLMKWMRTLCSSGRV